MNAKEILQEELREVSRINDEGALERLWRGKYWKIVKNVDNCTDGYCQLSFNSKIYRYHRIVWILLMGDITDKTLQIDHIDNNKLNNNINNLRLVSCRKNNQNRIQQNLQKKVGYTFNKRDKKWLAQIRINNNHIHLGYFDNELDASNIYNIACELVEEYVNNEQFRTLCKELL